MRHTTIISFLLTPLIWAIDAKSGKRIPSLQTGAAPKLTLPWGTYEGKPYGEDQETVLFNNVRFAKPPTGNLRFAAPQYPDAIKDPKIVQDSSFGPNCIQAAPKKTDAGGFPEPRVGDDITQAEDCLFLDVYVPTWALEPDNEEKLPVIVWIFGGAYIFGGKNTTFPVQDGAPYNAYDGEGIRQSASGSVIWVTGNYRLGAYGFSAGKYMEQNAQPNAGLHDQRLLLDWVQKYIGLIGGDKDAVNVWGLSAGGGSILHHLTAYGGTKKEASLFKRAALWSTAFQWSYDRQGSLENTFSSFAKAAGCGDKDDTMKCLRKAEPDALQKANQKVVSDRLTLGMFPFGPAVDGDLVPDIPANLLKQGKHVKVDSMMLAHNFDEARMFLADWVQTKDNFTQFIGYAFPGDALANVRKDIEKQYPSDSYEDQQVRTRIVLRDSTFICNNYQIYQAYKNTTEIYASRYEIPPAQHGSELMVLVWNPNANVNDIIQAMAPKIPDFLIDILKLIFVPIASTYQRYFAGHALSGDPNLLAGYRTIRWDKTTDDGDELINAMKIGIQYINPSFFRLGSDGQVSKTNCDFWDTTAQKVADAVKKGSVSGEMKSTSFRVQDPQSLWAGAQVEL